MDQRTLAERAREGDRDAFVVLARAAAARLDAAARLILRDREQARDAVQEALIRAWRDLPGRSQPRLTAPGAHPMIQHWSEIAMNRFATLTTAAILLVGCSPAAGPPTPMRSPTLTDPPAISTPVVPTTSPALTESPAISTPVVPTTSPATPTSAAPVLAWSFDDDVATEAGEVDLRLFGRHDFSDNAVSFDGETGYAASTVPAPVDTTSNFTVSTWVSLADPIEFAYAVSQVGHVAAAFYVGVGEGTWEFAMKDADTNDCCHTFRAKADPALVDLDEWFHLVGVHDAAAGENRLYVNGFLAASIDFDQPWQAEGELTIGRSKARTIQADFWPGSIASVAIYADALAASEVRAIHESTEPTGAPPAVESRAATLRGTWDHVLDEAARDAVVEDFKEYVESADEARVRFGFDGNDWWSGLLFDGEMVLVDGVPEGDGGSFMFDDDFIVMTGAGGEALIVYEWTLDGDSLTFNAVEECWIVAGETTCTEDQSKMEQLMLMLTSQTFTRSGDDPSY